MRAQLLFFAGLAVGLTTLWITDLIDQIRDYNQGFFYE